MIKIYSALASTIVFTLFYLIYFFDTLIKQGWPVWTFYFNFGYYVVLFYLFVVSPISLVIDRFLKKTKPVSRTKNYFRQLGIYLFVSIIMGTIMYLLLGGVITEQTLYRNCILLNLVVYLIFFHNDFLFNFTNLKSYLLTLNRKIFEYTKRK